MCHYCGYSEPFRDTCPECGEQDVRYAGFGTQRVEEELALLSLKRGFCAWMRDTTMARYAHEDKLAAFLMESMRLCSARKWWQKGLTFRG